MYAIVPQDGIGIEPDMYCIYEYGMGSSIESPSVYSVWGIFGGLCVSLLLSCIKLQLSNKAQVCEIKLEVVVSYVLRAHYLCNVG